MKRLLIAIIVCLMTVWSSQANPISREQAKQKAEQFLKDKSGQKRLSAVTSQKRLAPKKGAATAPDAYYVFDRGENGGFVIVSGDDQTIDVLGYCDNGSFDYEQLPPQLQGMLESYTRQIQAIQAGAPVLKLPANSTSLNCSKGDWSSGMLLEFCSIYSFNVFTHFLYFVSP